MSELTLLRADCIHLHTYDQLAIRFSIQVASNDCHGNTHPSPPEAPDSSSQVKEEVVASQVVPRIFGA